MKRLAVAAAALSLIPFGCSSDEDGAASAAEPTEAALVDAAAEANAALIAGGSDSYDWLSVRCQGEWTRGDWGAQVAMGMGMAAEFSGVALDEMRLGAPRVVEFNGTTARVRVDLVDEDGEVLFESEGGEGPLWVFEEGGWRLDDCEAMG